MANAKIIVVKETSSELNVLIKKTSAHLRPRIKMLQWILKGVHAIDALCSKVGVSRNSIALWKRTYSSSGISGLLNDNRGGDYRSGLSVADKEKIKEKLSEPKEAFRSYKEAQEWINTTLNTDKKYHAVNKYLKRNFGTKLKVGRKSHVKKDEEAVAFFKNPSGSPE